MSITALIGPQLPFLRRYARALTGNVNSGDAYVVAMLEALVADQSLYDKNAHPREALYSLFSKIWNSIPLNTSQNGVIPLSPYERRLEAITPLPRQAFLLTAVEGFSCAETARILDVTPDELTNLLDEAGKQIGSQVASRVVVIEDEPIIAMDLECLLEGLGHHVVGNARTHREAVTLFEAERPGLILADMRLADGSSGLDAVNEILKSFDVPVIFITAYPESLLTGERPEPTFLISKPFRPETVKAVVSQALFFNEAAKLKERRIA